jgi:peptide-methionine (S)-S-oxide reductase
MRRLSLLLVLGLVGYAGIGCRTVRTSDDAPSAKTTEGSHANAAVGNDPGGVGRGTKLVPKEGRQLAAFAAGCFWGVEDAFRHVKGVTATAVGYTGGHTDDPDYEAVCTHTTGHAETVLVEFDPKVTSYAHLLKVFFEIHDPTQLNRQGPDEGDQYRSEIFTFDDAEAKAARAAFNDYNAKNGGKVVTKIEPIPRFWKAEEYHQQYAEKTGSHGCPTKIPDEST